MKIDNILIAEELSPGMVSELGDGFVIRHVDGTTALNCYGSWSVLMWS